MKSIHICVLILTTLSLFACKDDEPIVRPSIYTSCCDIEPSEFVNNNASVFIPNAFTPNGDGINDLFVISTTNVDFIPRFEIRDQQDELVFSQINFSSYHENITWDGTVNHFGNEAIVGGLYFYELEFLTTNGTNKKMEGSVCAFLCDETFPADVEDCLLSTQLDENGFNSSTGTQEGKCFD